CAFAAEPPFTFSLSGSCAYSTSLPTAYAGDLSEFKFTTNDGNVTLEKAYRIWDTTYQPTLFAYLTVDYQPPVIFHYKGVSYDITRPSPGCVLVNKAVLKESKGQNLEISILISEPENGESLEVYVDDVKSGTFKVKLDTNNIIEPFSLYFPYTQYTHTVRFNRLSLDQSFSAKITYAKPEIISQECVRGFQKINADQPPHIINTCQFVGNKFHSFDLLSGVGIVGNARVSLTSISLNLTGNLVLGAPLTLDTKDGPYSYYNDFTNDTFRPQPRGSSSTFIYGKDANGFRTAIVKGSYLDAIAIDQVQVLDLTNNEYFNVGNFCRYSAETSLEDGYQEMLSCLVPTLKNYEKAAILLTPIYYPNQTLIFHTEKMASSSSYTTPSLSSLLFTLSLLSILFLKQQ
ncbi:hypothetical protein CYY_009745, partial [Polysphondylium violaceum]